MFIQQQSNSQKMSFGKQDELLQKLQRCVGKLQAKPCTYTNSQRYPQRDPPRYSTTSQAPQLQSNYKSTYKQKYGNNDHGVSKNINKQSAPLNGYSETQRHTNFKGNYSSQYQNHGYERYQGKNVGARDYLTQREKNIESQIGGYDKSGRLERRRQADQIRRKYDENVRPSISNNNNIQKQPPRKLNNYLQNSNEQYRKNISENITQNQQRRPFRQYDLNNTSIGNITKRQNIRQVNQQNSNKELKQQNKYLQELKKYNTNYQINNSGTKNNTNANTKYESYKRGESAFKPLETYRRNSISHNISQNQNSYLSSTGRKNQLNYSKNLQLSSKAEKYQSKVKQYSNVNGNMNQLRSFNSISHNQPYLKMNIQGSATKKYEQIMQESRFKQNCRSRPRNISVGTISSVSRRTPNLNIQQNIPTYQIAQSNPPSYFPPPANTSTPANPTNTINTNSFKSFSTNPRQQNQLNLKKVLDEVGNANQDTFTKLQKISQLNERINSRIKNIIETFQNK